MIARTTTLSVSVYRGGRTDTEVVDPSLIRSEFLADTDMKKEGLFFIKKAI